MTEPKNMKSNVINETLHGPYAITNHQDLGIKQLLEDVEKTLQGGAKLIQYRDKSGDQEKRLKEAKALLDLCQKYTVPLIINDDIELAATIGAPGVHLGKEDNDLNRARLRLGKEAIIGISCYNSLEQAIAAEKGGASYVAFGRFFSSLNKPEAIQAHPTLLQEAKQKLSLPVVAIGGITPENGDALVNAGADMLAIIQGIFGQDDIIAATKQFSPLFNSSES